MNDYDRMKAAIIDAVDRTMPGRRVGSSPRSNCMAQAQADAERLFATARAACPTFALSSVNAFANAQGLERDDLYRYELRWQLLLILAREESAKPRTEQGR